jgi:hypothetical protein
MIRYKKYEAGHGGARRSPGLRQEGLGNIVRPLSHNSPNPPNKKKQKQKTNHPIKKKSTEYERNFKIKIAIDEIYSKEGWRVSQGNLAEEKKLKESTGRI